MSYGIGDRIYLIPTSFSNSIDINWKYLEYIFSYSFLFTEKLHIEGDTIFHSVDTIKKKKN